MAPALLNCECEAISPYRTLAEVRRSILLSPGMYPAMADNPPAGVAAEIDEALRSAQKLLYRKHKELRTKRFFRWTMVQNVRFYGFADSDEGTDVDLCSKKLDPTTVTWVGYEDLNGRFAKMTDKIDPVMYTGLVSSAGYPSNYELRGSCIEIFPAPRDAYFLWVQGHFGLEPLVAETDRFTIDDEGVKLLALGAMKSARGKADAQAVLVQAATYEQAMVAATHGTKRYIPKVTRPPALPQPRLIQFEDGA